MRNHYFWRFIPANLNATGIGNAPATFQRLMDSTFRDPKSVCVLLYLDDVNVYSKTFEDHILDLKNVFTRFRDIGVKLKPRKCHFFKEKLEFLGHIVDQQGVSPLPSKIQAVSKMTPPASVKEY